MKESNKTASSFWRVIAGLVIMTIAVFFSPTGRLQVCEGGGLLYHATKKKIANRIASRGFSTRKMRSSARLGQGIYFSKSAGGAIREKGAGNAIVRAKPGKHFESRTIDMTRPSGRKIRGLMNVRDLRGAVKKNVLGPKVGHRLGSYAGKNGKILRYRSAKDPRQVNYFVPKATYQRKPDIIQGIRVKRNGRYR